MKKVLFIDRDGTLILEPKTDFQVDSLEKLEYYPYVFKWLGKIVEELDYELVMITNQDGLGTDSFPEDTFWPAHNKMLSAFKNEGIEFNEIFIDRSFEEENLPTRKPGIGLLGKYVYGNYDLEHSYVIGDRESDVQLAKNLGSQGIFIGTSQSSEAILATPNWREIYAFLSNTERRSIIERHTSETSIQINLNLDGRGESNVSTGLPFFDHMLEQIAKHGAFDLSIQATGDIEVDDHHMIEDVGLALGSAFFNALGSKKAIDRYGFTLPMDEALALVALDFSGRPYLVWDVEFKREFVGNIATEMFIHFFKSFTDEAKCNLNISVKGENEHHKIESIFKAFARCLKMAVHKNSNFVIPSTKGTL